jgi:long-chain fatty acid transport protein
MKKISLLTAAALSLSNLAGAGSFQLNLQGIRQTAMGGSGVAWPWDASTIFFNPGGLSRISGIQAYGNLFMVSPSVRYVQTPTGNYQANTEKSPSTPFAFYIGGTLKEDSKLGFGVGVYTPFGNSLKWGDDWRGRYLVQDIALQSIFIQPTASYAINDNISLGLGLIYALGSMEINRALPIQDRNGADGSMNLKGNANGLGYNIGVQVKVNQDLQFGISYRSGVKMKLIDGEAQFDVAESVAGNFPAGLSTNFKTNLPLPGILTVGAGYKVCKGLTLQGDLVLAGWKSYDSLKFDFTQETVAVTNRREPRSYRNTLAVRLGGNYEIMDNMSLGLSYQPIEKLTIMAVANYTTTSKRTVTYAPANFRGAYQIKSLAPGIGISYTF